jgi:prepilin-type N-terminal cleavage/methylation domain-containing protein
MSRCPRGYTLLEFVVASAMAAIITTAGLSAFAMFNRHRVRMERAVSADETAKIVLQYLVRET